MFNGFCSRWRGVVVSVSNLISDVRERLKASDFDGLLIEVLGWDNPSQRQTIRVDVGGDRIVALSPVAAKRGMTVYLCNEVPTADAMAKIDRAVSKKSLERLIVYADDSRQLWRWPEARKSGGTRFVSHRFEPDSPSDALVQRLVSVNFELGEEQSLTILDVLHRVRSAFNSDEVTEKFYREYKANHEMLCGNIKGLRTPEDKSWYASLMLNRLMFIYFMQKKGFLDNNVNYLRDSLFKVQSLRGKNKFYQYYRDFLLPLFHEGLGSENTPQVDAEIQQVIGDVPYINGGIFAKHLLEESGRLDIPDQAFDEVFAFLDQYRWHLDERTVAGQGEINPEVLGYIFEKYVNQKQQGAYYTKEDVTGYMVTSTIIPVVIERLEAITGQSCWPLVKEQPLRYVPESMRFGMDQDIPSEVLSAPLDEYGKLDESTDLTIGLPGERWRETLDRHARVRKVVDRASRGEVTTCEHALELNLDILTLALDLIATFVEPAHIAHTWTVLKGLNVLDPTCGSGAFLFAAADVLEELYEVVIDRAVEIAKDGRDTKNRDLAGLINEMQRHPSDSYFRLKTIVLENIYGVDIMAEAIEIARLRLFLTLVARLERRDEIEPLPDLDMNVKVGNTLVGCSTFENAEETFSGSLFAMQKLSELKPQVEVLTVAYNDFVEVQRNSTSGAKLIDAKRHLIKKTQEVRLRLDQLYASETGVSESKFEKWKETHLPFHWFVEFPEAMSSGGFDVVIGNPPYIKRADVVKQYQFTGFKSGELYDIFAPCMERSTSLLRRDGAFSMIVPIAFQFSKDYRVIREVIAMATPTRFVCTFSRNPASLFDASVGVRSTICTGFKSGETTLYTSPLRRWVPEGRPHLFQTICYAKTRVFGDGSPWPRIGTNRIAELGAALHHLGRTMGHSTQRHGETLGFKQIALYYMSVFVDEPPSWNLNGSRVPQTKVGFLRFASAHDRDIAYVLLSGRLAGWWWGSTGDDFDVTVEVLESFPIGLDNVSSISTRLRQIARKLRVEQLKHPLVTKYAGKVMGNYDMSRCRHITDQADRLVLEHLGLGEYWPDVLLADARLAKVTGERPGTRREWPFPL